eukprot:2934826-Amphidinium_carterae.1
MSMTSFQRMKVSAAPGVEICTGRVIVADATHKKSMELDTDTNKEDHYVECQESDISLLP